MATGWSLFSRINSLVCSLILERKNLVAKKKCFWQFFVQFNICVQRLKAITQIQNPLEGIYFHLQQFGMSYYINMLFIPPERLGFRGNMLILLLFFSTLNNWIEKRVYSSAVFFYWVFARIFNICFTVHPPSASSHATRNRLVGDKRGAPSSFELFDKKELQESWHRYNMVSLQWVCLQ